MKETTSFSILGVALLAFVVLASSSVTTGFFTYGAVETSTDDPQVAAPQKEDRRIRLAVDAGQDLKVKEFEKVNLDASSSDDANGETLSYSWKLLSPKNSKIDLGDTSKKSLSFDAPSIGNKGQLVLVFRLTVSDGTSTGRDTVKVVVTPAEGGEPKVRNNIRTITVTDAGEPAGKFSVQDLCGDGTYAYSIMTAGVKWRTFPVTFAIDAANSHMDVTLAKNAIRKVFTVLDAQINPTVTNFRESTTYSSAQIKISWRPMDGPYGQLGYTSYSYRLDTKAMISATVAFDSLDKYFVSSIDRCSASGSSFDLQNIATHELGHAINLGHVSDRLQSMYPTSYAGETLKRSLGNGDKLGIKNLYG
jgi:predicted Zn-dependent protease